MGIAVKQVRYYLAVISNFNNRSVAASYATCFRFPASDSQEGTAEGIMTGPVYSQYALWQND